MKFSKETTNICVGRKSLFVLNANLMHKLLNYNAIPRVFSTISYFLLLHNFTFFIATQLCFFIATQFYFFLLLHNFLLLFASNFADSVLKSF